MNNNSWKIIINEIKKCRLKLNSDKVVKCLKKVFSETNDGMAAYALGEELEKKGDYEESEKYYERAESLFPLEKYKAKARASLIKIRNRISGSEQKTTKKTDAYDLLPGIILSELDQKETLFIVSCSKRKIWDSSYSAPIYVPARYAYKGDSFVNFLNWLEQNELEKKGFFWMILSGKYGFVEPWHPISKYDINLNETDSYSISTESLINQIYQKRWWKHKDGIEKELKLADFYHIICINCHFQYKNKIKSCFHHAQIEFHDTHIR